MPHRKMNRPACWAVALVSAGVLLVASRPLAAAEPTSLDEARPLREQAVAGLTASAGDAALHEFIRRHVSGALLAALPEAELLERLCEVRRIGAGAGGIDLRGTEDGVVFAYRGAVNANVIVALERESPFKIVDLRIEAVDERQQDAIPPISWGTLAAQLDQAEASGFAGVVLVVRNGKTVLHRGYGMANRERGVRHTTETIFDIGSTPIDFTKAAVLLLEQRGKLALSDSLARFFSGAPADKRGITIEQLMSARSGLPNFHHRPGVDEDYDLSPLGRDEAVERILASELLFEPGKGEAHSHSAWGLLAAIVEIAGGTTYQQFLRRNFFEPAGMKRTGSYGWRGPHDESDFAVGYGSNQGGQPNIPPRWGPTSWLVMGSGGMVSNPSDMLKWTRFIMAGKVLGPQARAKFAEQLVLAGGSDRGFLFTYSQGFESGFFLASNTHERAGDLPSRLTRALARLVKESERN